METKPSEPAFADEETVREALDNLSQHDFISLERIAKTWTSLTLGRDYKDLLKEAVVRTLTGQRRWNTRVDFTKHLSEAMRSIASSWRKQDKEESEATRLSKEADNDSVMRDARSREPDIERALDAKIRLEKICAEFKDCPVESQVFSGWRMGCSGPEIRELGDISKNEYEAAVKKIRRRARKEAGNA